MSDELKAAMGQARIDADTAAVMLEVISIDDAKQLSTLVWTLERAIARFELVKTLITDGKGSNDE